MALSKAQVTGHLVRVAWDLLILALGLLVVLAGLWAYHGEQAFQYLARVTAAQQAAQNAQRPAPAPPQDTK